MNGDINTKYQVSLFGDFSLITPTEEIVKKCIELFFVSGLLPTNAQELDTNTNKMEPRLSLQSMRNGLNINILSNRIDFLVTPVPGSPAASLDIKSFFQEVVTIADKLKTEFDLTFKRIGAISEKFLREMAEEKLESLRKLFIQDTFDFIPQAKPSEWNVRSVGAMQFEDPINQSINVIHSLAKVNVQISDNTGHREFDTLHVSIDVNIPVEKRTSNLSSDQIDKFLKKTSEVQKQILDGLAKVIESAE
ncbi:hypothetical protein [Pseudomonas fragariae (ex Marin et al. 2024)]|uniref:hypothetical protein n=1 Tax=Pseudomonas fragariae (ex Marin et al. 2024) TaxID=3080056 RepID=UPI003F79B23E